MADQDTIKIRLRTSVASTSYTYAAGQEVNAPAEIAKDLIQAGHAEPVAVRPEQRAEKPLSPADKAEKRSSK
jgi:hypothetical protein